MSLMYANCGFVDEVVDISISAANAGRRIEISIDTLSVWLSTPAARRLQIELTEVLGLPPALRTLLDAVRAAVAAWDEYGLAHWTPSEAVVDAWRAAVDAGVIPGGEPS